MTGAKEPPASEPPAAPDPAPRTNAARPDATEPRSAAGRPGRGRSPLLLVHDAPLPAPLASFPAVSADHYLEGDADSLDEGLTVVNLCRNYTYLSRGYYVSLVAEARRQRVLPPLEALEGANNPFSYFRVLQEAGVRTLDYRLQPGRRLVPRRIALGEAGERSAALVGDVAGADGRPQRLERSQSGWLDVSSAFGFARDRRFRYASATIYRVYPFPLLRFRMFHTEDGWRLGQIQPLPLPQATPDEIELLAERLGRGLTALAATAPPPPRLHRLAMLYDPDDPTAPSDEAALDRLARVAARRGLLAERIGKNEIGRLAEYDALFIRTVTAINHVSFTFAQTASGLGMPVIDDPASIVKCSNKIFLYELFRKHGLPMPDTTVLSPRNWHDEVRPLGWPVVLKVPDGTFSLAVKMARSEAELEALAKELFRKTPLLLAQRFTPSTFDWRVGVLEGKPLWTARYHMAPGHWQIADRSGRSTRFGKVEAVPIEQCPPQILELALAGTALIGDGLYGVDIKETEGGPVLIEINDNPNLEAGYEDAAEKDRPYEAIVDCFLRRIEAEGRTGTATGPGGPGGPEAR